MKTKLTILYFFGCFFFLNAQQIVNQSRILGVTIDDPYTQIPNIKKSLSNLCYKPTTRIVFDENVAASDYKNAVAEISSVSFVMGEILDSFYMKDYTVTKYLERTKEYLDAFENQVTLWEIGNEVNGEWLKSQVIEKIEGAFTMVRARNKKTVLTLYYNKDCYEKAQNEMFTWVKNLPASMKQNLDYVLVSYYEDDCNHTILTEAEWNTVFDKLHQIFPNSKLGMGECGTTKRAKKSEYLNRYYNMNIKTPNYIGGYFWWYFKQDCVPKTKPLWNELNTISCQWAQALDVDNYSPENFSIVPNPSSGTLSISSNERIHHIEIYSLLGRKLKLIQGENHTISIADLPKGMLLVKIRFKNNQSIVRKIIHR